MLQAWLAGGGVQVPKAANRRCWDSDCLFAESRDVTVPVGTTLSENKPGVALSVEFQVQ